MIPTIPSPGKELINSYLIQILMAPSPPPKDGKYRLNPFTFGGGGGRFSQEALDLLLPIFNFYYMGASEFEWGAVPLALSKIAERAKDYISFEVQIPVTEIMTFSERLEIGRKTGKRPKAVNLAREKQQRRKRHEPPAEVERKTVYVFTHKDWREECELRVRQLAVEEQRLNAGRGTKCSVNLAEALKGERPDFKGWLEIDNGWFFFTDKTMCENVVKLFAKDDDEQTDGSDAEGKVPEVGGADRKPTDASGQ